jgi:hypothetical protein
VRYGNGPPIGDVTPDGPMAGEIARHLCPRPAWHNIC